jgi:predicted metal-dependent phosphotriesterase family hydrolase
MMLKKLIENAAENNDVKRVIADGAYDNNENFRYLSDNDIEAAIKVRKNSSANKITDSHPRNIVVLQQLKNFEKWKDSVSYGYRWIAETVFSSIKRMFGECVSARKYSNMVKEMMLKASLYNTFITRK